MRKLSTEELKDLFDEVRRYLTENKILRLGQGFMNRLNLLFPDIANEIVGNSDLDPYYDNSKLIDCVNHICDEEAVMFWQQSHIYDVLFVTYISKNAE